MSKKQAVNDAVADVDFSAKKYQIHFETSMGDITLDLMPEIAPGHCKNMIGLTKIGFYDGLIFHRVISGFMIQGGCPLGNGTGNPGYQIAAEFNSTPHVLGVLSMARSSAPDSAGSQFFLCLDDAPHLDNNYTAFGQAADQASRDVISKIGVVPTNRSDRPDEDVTIVSAKVIES